MFTRCALPESSLASDKPRADFDAYLPEIRRQPDYWISLLASTDADDAFVDLVTTMLGKTMRASLSTVRRRTVLQDSGNYRFPEFCDPNLAMVRVTRKHALQTLALSLVLRNFDRLEDMCEVVNVGSRFAPNVRLDSSHGESGIKYGNRVLLGPAYAEDLFGPFPPDTAGSDAWYQHDELPIFVRRNPAHLLAEQAVRFQIEQGVIMETLEPYMAACSANVPALGHLAAEN